MDPRGAWERVEPLLDRALDLPPSDRRAFVQRASDGDQALLERVTELLGAAELVSFLDGSAHEVVAGLVEEMVEESCTDTTASAPPFERVGPYRLLHEIGRGGMGAVYLGERDDEEFRRQVAVKLVPPAAAPALRTRFLAERQILASLDHPNIARLYDGGTAVDGTPYLVMQFIAGQRIDAYCEDRRLTVEERLELFDTVCATVEFAHRNLVVHRDLKPSNVLVADDGTVTLLDFGVAKLLEDAAHREEALQEEAPLTQTGARAMTPEYASPEQLRGEPVTTATDVYSLGVLLYGLLSGRRPYDLSGRSPSETERIVSHQEPKMPSLAAAEAGLRRRLAGDLDNIVLMAIRKEPERRYPSVYHLRDDLRRHLEGFPVAAGPPTFRYRTGKMLRRHRVGFVAGAAVGASLVGGLAATMWQARLAAREARRAREVRDFVVGIFEGADPDSTLGETVTAKELLDRGAERLESELAAEPAIRAEMLGVVGRIYRSLGLYRQARPLLEEAHAVRREREPGSAELADSAGELASVMYDQGEYDRAEPLAREALEVRRRRSRKEPAALSAALSALAGILSTRGQVVVAETLHREALTIDRRLRDGEALASHLDEYGVSLSRDARHDRAKRVHEKSLAVRRELYGPDHTLIATTLLNLAAVEMERGEYPRAEALLQECLAMRRKLLGEGHPHVALVLNTLGDLFQRAGRLDDSEDAHRKALAIQRTAMNETHPDVANSMNHIGVALYFKGLYAESAEMFEQVLPLWRASYGPNHSNVFSVLNNLGAARRGAGEYDAAERVLRETLALRREAFGDAHQDVAQSLNNLAPVLAKRGSDAEAEASFLQAIATWRRTLGDEHPHLGYGLVDLGRFLFDHGRFAEAEPPLREGLAIREASLDDDAPLLASARFLLGECLVELGRLEEARSLLTASLPILRQRWGEDNDDVCRNVRALRETELSGSPS